METTTIDLGSHRAFVSETLTVAEKGEAFFCKFYVENERGREVWRSEIPQNEGLLLDGKLKEHIQTVAEIDFPEMKLGEEFKICDAGYGGGMWAVVNIQTAATKELT